MRQNELLDHLYQSEAKVGFVSWYHSNGMECSILIPVFGKIGNGNHVIHIPMDLLSRSINKSV